MADYMDPIQVQTPGIDPRYASLAMKQRQKAEDYAAQIPEMAAKGRGLIAQKTSGQLSAANRNIDQSTNARGAYYSGQRISKRAGAAGAAAQQVGQQTMQMNQGLTDNLQRLQDQGIQSGFGMAGVSQDIGDLYGGAQSNAMADALARMQNNDKALGGLGSGVGSVMGAYLGNRG